MGRPRSPEPPRLSPGVEQDGGEAELQHLPGTHAELPAERALQELDAVLGTSRAIRGGTAATALPPLSSRRRSASAAS